jgi:hypothetical protein
MALLTLSVMAGEWHSGDALSLAHPEFRTPGQYIGVSSGQLYEF